VTETETDTGQNHILLAQRCEGKNLSTSTYDHYSIQQVDILTRNFTRGHQ